MNDMKKLYALLGILIVIYISINFAYNGLDTLNNLNHINLGNNLNIGGGDNDENSIRIGTSSFIKLENFQETKVNDTEVSLSDSNNLTIYVQELDDSLDFENFTANLIATNENITSNQTIMQNGISAYFLYEENSDSYNADIYFNKNDKNYLISGESISYDNSDYFINKCKDIINSMKTSNGINYSRF